MRDEKGPDEKILCVPLRDPAWSHVSDLTDLPSALLAEIEHFFSVYKDLEERTTETVGFRDARVALDVIEAARHRFQDESVGARPRPELIGWSASCVAAREAHEESTGQRCTNNASALLLAACAVTDDGQLQGRWRPRPARVGPYGPRKKLISSSQLLQGSGASNGAGS